MNMMNDQRASVLMDKYGDDLYRFAFILTGTDNDAAEVFSGAFAAVCTNKLFTGKDKEDREILFCNMYKAASKLKTAALYDGKYGKKSDTFDELMELPLNERAVAHLIMYEDMTEQEANGVINRK